MWNVNVEECSCCQAILLKSVLVSDAGQTLMLSVPGDGASYGEKHMISMSTKRESIGNFFQLNCFLQSVMNPEQVSADRCFPIAIACGRSEYCDLFSAYLIEWCE